jgi:GcrA cell cycle regulator
MTTIKDTPWTPELRERFKKLYEAGVPHSEIARELGVTKNASIRQSTTLKLPPRRSSYPRKSAKREGKIVVDLPSLGAIPYIDVVEVRVKPADGPEYPVILPDPVKFMDLRHWHCRWPLSRGEDGQFTYCGAPKIEGSSYCQHHHERSYVNAPRPR